MSSETTEAMKARDAAWRVFAVVAAAAAAVAVMVVAFLMLRFLIAAKGWSTFADVYGALVGLFFAAMAFAGIILTVHLQRIEMRAAREEMRRAAEAQEDSVKALAEQVNVAQLTARLEASQAIFEYYDDLSKSLVRKPDMMELVLKTIFLSIDIECLTRYLSETRWKKQITHSLLNRGMTTLFEL